VLLALYKELTTKAQYQQGGEAHDLTQWSEIPGAPRLPEEGEHRLALAEKVLNHALGILEFEVTIDQYNEKLAKEEAASTPSHTPGMAGSGGYN
jgi:hypothetical protein